ncbi:MAG: hypothetical protein RSA24_01275 [Clostridia bacterium]
MKKSDISWQSVGSLFRLDIKSRFGTSHNVGIKKRTAQGINYLFALAVYAILVLGIYYLSNMFVVRSGLRIEFLVIVATFTLILSTVIATGNVIKNLYMNGDNELLLRFPVNGKEIYISKSIYCYLHNLVVCFLLMMPFYIVFGIVTHASVGFYFAAIAISFLSTWLPFFIANILAVPVMRLMNLVRNQFLLVLLGVVVVICLAFIAYLQTLSNVLNYLGTENQTLFSPEMIVRYKTFAQYAYPFNWYANLLNGKLYGGLTSGGIALQFLYIFLLNAVLGVIAYLVSTKAYYKTILYGIENAKVSFVKKTTNRQRSVFSALVRREFYLILRSFNYSFQYLAMAIAAPVMVFFCNRLATTLGTESLGGQIVPGLTMLVIIIFVTIIVSFASTTISRESNSFYLTKVVPVSFHTQIACKFFLYAVVASASVVLCCLVTGCTYATPKSGYLMKPSDVVAIFFISEMFVISLTSLAIWADIKYPTFNVSGDGELVAANKNVAVSLFTGIILAVAFSVFTMLFSFLPLNLGPLTMLGGIADVYIILSMVSILILAFSLTLLFANLNKRYDKIAQ